MLRKPKPN